MSRKILRPRPEGVGRFVLPSSPCVGVRFREFPFSADSSRSIKGDVKKNTSATTGGSGEIRLTIQPLCWSEVPGVSLFRRFISFYKRGCQEKYFGHDRREWGDSSYHPALVLE